MFLYISAKYENVVMYGDTAPDSSKCLANLMMKYSCAVGGPKEQLLFSVQSILGLEDTMLGINEGTWWNLLPTSSSMKTLPLQAGF